MRLLFFWLVAPKKISPDFLKKPLVVRLFRPFYKITARVVMPFLFLVRTEKDIHVFMNSRVIGISSTTMFLFLPVV